MISPRVWDGTAYKRRLHPLQCNVSQTLQPLSVVTMTLPHDDELNNFDWVAIDYPDGTTEAYRVASITIDAGSGDKTVYMEHGACLLDDILMPETGTLAPLAMKDTVANIVAEILSKQGTWVSGTIEATETIYVELGNLSLMTALLTVMDSIPAYQIEFVQGETWHVDIKRRPTEPSCEVRLGRNLVSCDIAYNTGNLCTRVYAEGLTDGHMDSANISLYGLHEHTMSLNDGLTQAQKEEIVSAYLAQHDHPEVSISISGIELSQVTGLPIDRFTLGKVCRVVIPWLGVVQNQVIVDKTYPDLYADSENVTITLANPTPDLSYAIASITGGGASGGGGGGGGGNGKGGDEAKKQRFNTYFEKTDEHFRLLATETEWDAMEHGTITAYSQITQTASSLQTVVTKTGINNLQENETLYSQIDQNATAIALKVSRGEVATQLAVECGNVTITGGNLVVQGMVLIEDGTVALGGATVEAHTYEGTYGEIDTVSSGNVDSNIVQAHDELYVENSRATWQTLTVVTDATAGTTASIRFLGSIVPSGEGGT